MASLQDLVTANDPAVFRYVRSQSSVSDRIAFLQLQNFVAGRVQSYAYLETGSFLGGTLVPHCADSRCRKIFSIDTRVIVAPNQTTDAESNYGDNSTAEMIARLRSLPDLNVDKVQTFDMDAGNVRFDDVGSCVDLVLIDGEHTDRAVVSDFVNCRRFCKPDALIAFHDFSCVREGIRRIMQILRSEGSDLEGIRLGGDVFVLIPRHCLRNLPDYLQYYSDRRLSFWAREAVRRWMPRFVIRAIHAVTGRVSRSQWKESSS